MYPDTQPSGFLPAAGRGHEPFTPWRVVAHSLKCNFQRAVTSFVVSVNRAGMGTYEKAATIVGGHCRHGSRPGNCLSEGHSSKSWCGVAAAGLVWLSRCRHSGGLGLLPPTTADDGTRTPAKWYCDACGRAWPIGLEHERTPVVRFSGYDQSKLPASARRAAAHDKQRHSLAVKRAGLVVRADTAAGVRGNVTSINQRRAAR